METTLEISLDVKSLVVAPAGRLALTTNTNEKYGIMLNRQAE